MNELSRRRFLLASLLGTSSLVWLRDLPVAVAQEDVEALPAKLAPPLRATLEAAMSRILPAEGGAGAVEAGCTGFVEALVRDAKGPWNPFYESGLAALDSLAVSRTTEGFASLGPEERDRVLEALEAGDVDGWTGSMPARDFFDALRTHTVWAFLADPKHGGNRDHTGWKAVGYPGPGHAKGVPPDQVEGKEERRPVWNPGP